MACIQNKIEPHREKSGFLHMRKTKTQISCAVIALLINAFVFAAWIVQSLFNLYLTTLPTSPIVFLLYFKNGLSNQIQLLTIDSTFHDTRTDVKLIENYSELCSILAKI